MPGKTSRERRRQRQIAAMQEFSKKAAEYIANGGEKICGACVMVGRCPVHPETADMPCWVFDSSIVELPPPPTTCKCTMAQRLVGDGCQVCNPEKAKEFEEEI